MKALHLAGLLLLAACQVAPAPTTALVVAVQPTPAAALAQFGDVLARVRAAYVDPVSAERLLTLALLGIEADAKPPAPTQWCSPASPPCAPPQMTRRASWCSQKR